MRTVKTLLLCSACALAAPAFAQDQADSTSDEANAEAIVVSGKYTIDDRIDTATGLGLTVRETPQSVSVITAQRILDQNLITIADVIENGVGVTVTETDDVRNSFFARGFEIRNTQIDSVPTSWQLGGAAGETIADLSIYERVEIVRGATGLLSGAGDPSASINLVRKHADSAEWTGYVSASYGSWDTWRATGDIGGAVTSDGRIRVRAVARYEQGESYIDIYENEKYVLYGVVDANITDSTLLRAGISYQDGSPSGQSWGALPSFYTDGSFIEWDRSRSTSADWTYWKTQNTNIFATLSHDFGGGWSVTANYNRFQNDQQTALLYMYGMVDPVTGTIQYSNPYSDAGESKQDAFDAQIKGRLSFLGRDHDLVVGALHSKINRFNNGFAAPYPGAFPNDFQFVDWDGQSFPEPDFATTGARSVEERIEQTGYYGAVRLNLADSFKIIAGGRLASWEQTGFAYGVPSDYGDDNVFIPYVGALFDITPQHRLYASYTKIFQPQNALDETFTQIDPLDGKAYEIGLKSAFFGEKLQTSIALFRIEQDNLAILLGQAIPPGGGLPLSIYRPADSTVSEGFELEVTGEPLEGWNVNFGASHFKVEDENGDPINTDQGRTLVKLFTTYTASIGDHALTVGGGANYRSKSYSDGLNPATGDPFRFQQDGYTLVSVMARFEVNDQLQLQANLENLLDKTYYAQTGFYSQYRYGAPRNFTVGATYKF
jgi:outer membrane receptor for ferric coprogen and ferric-rhodotorulic acid